MRIVLVCVLLVLSGCADPAIYRDPVSGQVMQCTSQAGGFFPIRAKQEIDACTSAYERMGWKKQ